MSRQLEQMQRMLARGLSRRDIAARIGAGTGASLLGLFGLRNPAEARVRCRRICTGQQCNPGHPCPTHRRCVCDTSGGNGANGVCRCQRR